MGTPVAELIRTWRAAASDGGGVHLPVVTGADMVDNEEGSAGALAAWLPGCCRGGSVPS
jgi:hypothetical protein